MKHTYIIDLMRYIGSNTMRAVWLDTCYNLEDAKKLITGICNAFDASHILNYVEVHKDDNVTHYYIVIK